jgi:hypothetical protein
MTEYWKELIGIAGGLLVIWRLIDMGKKVVTKGELKEHCDHQMELIQANIKVAVLEGMNEWLRRNGNALKK